MINYEEISEGVRELVRELNEVHGVVTSDSGDGSSYEAGMVCALPARHVFMRCLSQPAAYTLKARLEKLYPEALVQVTDPDPSGDGWVLLWPDGEADYGPNPMTPEDLAEWQADEGKQ